MNNTILTTSGHKFLMKNVNYFINLIAIFLLVVDLDFINAADHLHEILHSLFNFSAINQILLDLPPKVMVRYQEPIKCRVEFLS